MSRYLATGQSEIVLGKTHPILLKTVLLSCSEMSSDLNYNNKIILALLLGKLSSLDILENLNVLTLEKIRTLTRVDQLSHNDFHKN